MGLVKGLIVGGLIGYGLAVAGMATPGAFIAYAAAAAAGVVISLIAGKPIWAKDSRIEVGMKAGAGAVLAPGLMWLVRHFLTMRMPFDVSSLPGLDAVSSSPAVGMFAVTAIALVAGLLGGFYDADNQPAPAEEAKDGAKPSRQRVAAGAGGDPAVAEAAELEAAEAEAAARRAQK